MVDHEEVSSDEALQASMARLAAAAEGDDAVVAELHEHALREIEKAQQNADPRHQTYIKRTDTGVVVRSEEEYDYCMKNNVPVAPMSFNAAVSSLQRQEAFFRSEKDRKAKRKRAKAARKRNRS